MTKISVKSLTEAQETLLLPLWARAREASHPEPLLHDAKAVELVESIDYDFHQFERRNVDRVGFCGRAVVFDQLVRRFLEQHPTGTVVEIGAGLDTRFDRLDNGTVQWFDLDLPAAMEVRRRFFQETPRRRFLATSVLEKDWLATVEQSGPEAVMFVAEGVFYFLTEEQLRGLFARLADRFPGSRILFDSESPLYVWYSNIRHPLRDSKIIWGIRNIRQIEDWDPRFCVEESIGFGDRPYYDRTLHRYRWLYRTARRLFPPVRNMFRINVVRLG